MWREKHGRNDSNGSNKIIDSHTREKQELTPLSKLLTLLVKSTLSMLTIIIIIVIIPATPNKGKYLFRAIIDNA